MTVCLVLQGDSASPGARERMCSGSHYWRRSTPSTRLEGVPGQAGCTCQFQGSGDRSRAGADPSRDSSSEAQPAVAFSCPIHPLSLPPLQSWRAEVTPRKRACVFSLSSAPDKKDVSICLFSTLGDRRPRCRLRGGGPQRNPSSFSTALAETRPSPGPELKDRALRISDTSLTGSGEGLLATSL